LIQKIKNPLFDSNENPETDLSKLKSPTSYSEKNRRKKEYKKLFNKESAIEATKEFEKNVDVFGFTKGQFSLIDLIEATLDKTGPAHLTVSTWTAKTADLQDVLKFLDKGRILSARFLIDYSFQRRQPGAAQAIRQKFGKGSVKVSMNHAKFFMLGNDDGWKVTCKTSMNLNTNPRFEDFDLSNCYELFNFMQTMTAEIFSKGVKDGNETGSDVWSDWG